MLKSRDKGHVTKPGLLGDESRGRLWEEEMRPGSQCAVKSERAVSVERGPGKKQDHPVFRVCRTGTPL